MTNRAWRVVIVDDEPLARQTLRLLLTREADFVLAAEATHAKGAIEAIGTVRPDVVFLDVHMPELDGFAVVPHLDTALPPLVVFVTAFERHALQAFEAQAFDYLLKPFTDERFADVVRRLRGRLREREHARTSPPPMRTLLVRDGTRTIVVPHDDIVWIESRGLLRAHPLARPHGAGARVAAIAGGRVVGRGFRARAPVGGRPPVSDSRDGAAELRRPAADADERNKAQSQSDVSHSPREGAVRRRLAPAPPAAR